MNKAANDLAVWLVRNRVSKDAFAKRLDVQMWTLNRWLRAAKLPSIVEAARIEDATFGEVKTKDWAVPFRFKSEDVVTSTAEESVRTGCPAVEVPSF